MPPTIYLVRHAEGENNTMGNTVHDALLTANGRIQARALRDTFPYGARIDSVMSSPLRRAIQTASIAFGPIIARPDVGFTLLPMAQEANGHPCDVGHAPGELKGMLRDLVGDAVFDAGKIDNAMIEEGWNNKQGIYAIDHPTVRTRAAQLRAWLCARPEKNIVLVTHGKFMHFLDEDWSSFDEVRGTGWHNCEVRLYDFTPGSTPDDAHLYETEESKSARVQPV